MGWAGLHCTAPHDLPLAGSSHDLPLAGSPHDWPLRPWWLQSLHKLEAALLYHMRHGIMQDAHILQSLIKVRECSAAAKGVHACMLWSLIKVPAAAAGVGRCVVARRGASCRAPTSCTAC